MTGAVPVKGARRPRRRHDLLVPETVAVSIVLGLQPSDAPPPDGNLVRRGLLAQIREHDPEAAETLHADPGPSGHPWSVSDAFTAHDRWWVRVTCIGGLRSRLLGRALRPGRLPATRGWRVASVSTWRARAVRVEDLYVAAASRDAIVGVTLLSPTSLVGVDGIETPKPDPMLLLGCWARRWTAHLGEATLPDAVPRQRRVLRRWIADHTSMTASLLTLSDTETSRQLRVTASQGFIALRFTGPSETVAALATLARFGTFSSTGRRLAHGFGQTVMAARPLDWNALVQLHAPLARDARAITMT